MSPDTLTITLDAPVIVVSSSGLATACLTASSALSSPGAVVFSVIGILYLKHRGKGKLAASLIPQVRDTDAEASEK